MVHQTTFRVPPRYMDQTTLTGIQSRSDLVTINIPRLSFDSSPQLNDKARQTIVYANLTLGALIDGGARIDFREVRGFEKDARRVVESQRRAVGAEGAEDAVKLRIFGERLGVTTKYGPEVWVVVMEKVVRKIEALGIWKHTPGVSVAKSLAAAAQDLAPWGGSRSRSGGVSDPPSSQSRARSRSCSVRVQSPSPAGRASAGTSAGANARQADVWSLSSNSSSSSEESEPDSSDVHSVASSSGGEELEINHIQVHHHHAPPRRSITPQLVAAHPVPSSTKVSTFSSSPLTRSKQQRLRSTTPTPDESYESAITTTTKTKDRGISTTTPLSSSHSAALERLIPSKASLRAHDDLRHELHSKISVEDAERNFAALRKDLGQTNSRVDRAEKAVVGAADLVMSEDYVSFMAGKLAAFGKKKEQQKQKQKQKEKEKE